LIENQAPKREGIKSGTSGTDRESGRGPYSVRLSFDFEPFCWFGQFAV